MKVMLKTAVKKLIDKDKKELKELLLEILKENSCEKTWLREDEEPIEVSYKSSTIVFTWETIYAYKFIPHAHYDYIDFTSQSEDECIIFLESY